MTTLGLLLGLVILILSVIAHEVAHGYAADALGDPTARMAGRLTLNPLPHIDFLGSIVVPALLVLSGSPILFGWARPVPYNPYNLRGGRYAEFLVAIAGVATNLFIAVVFALVARFGTLAGFDATALGVAATISFVNLFLGMFNLIPFPPLDGFTALRAILPWRWSMGFSRFDNSMRSMGPFALIAFLLVFSYVLSGPFYTLVLFIFHALSGA